MRNRTGAIGAIDCDAGLGDTVRKKVGAGHQPQKQVPAWLALLWAGMRILLGGAKPLPNTVAWWALPSNKGPPGKKGPAFWLRKLARARPTAFRLIAQIHKQLPTTRPILN